MELSGDLAYDIEHGYADREWYMGSGWKPEDDEDETSETYSTGRMADALMTMLCLDIPREIKAYIILDRNKAILYLDTEAKKRLYQNRFRRL